MWTSYSVTVPNVSTNNQGKLSILKVYKIQKMFVMKKRKQSVKHNHLNVH